MHYFITFLRKTYSPLFKEGFNIFEMDLGYSSSTQPLFIVKRVIVGNEKALGQHISINRSDIVSSERKVLNLLFKLGNK